METEKPPKDLVDQFKKRAEDLATKSNEQLRTVVYRLMLSASKSERAESDWMLLVAGGTLALILPNAKDLLDVYCIGDFKIATGLLLASGIFGLLAKGHFRVLENAIDANDPHSKNISEALIDYAEKISTLKKEATEKGIDMKIPASSFKGLFEPFEKINLQNARSHVASELDLRDKDPHHKWKEPLKSKKLHSVFFSGQTLLLVSAFGIMLMKLHVAK